MKRLLAAVMFVISGVAYSADLTGAGATFRIQSILNGPNLTKPRPELV